MPLFLTRQEIYRILQRELPDDCYADGAPSAFFTTADMASVAKTIATAYSNLERIYVNYFPQTADEKIGDWEVEVFGFVSDAVLTLQERRDRVVQKLLNRPGITKADMERAVTGEIPSLGPSGFEIIEWGCGCCGEGAWILDESELDVSTFLNGQNLVDAVGPGLCDASPADYGKTPAEWAEMQEEAYTFEVRIFNRVLTAAERASLDARLTAAEPARSTHVITDNLTEDDRVGD